MSKPRQHSTSYERVLEQELASLHRKLKDALALCEEERKAKLAWEEKYKSITAMGMSSPYVRNI